ncbi:FAU ubiquitin-like and ribosomal protein S30 [Paramacrobiotus metropolitanus]|uniref:FAU ubiquitin-like and ribosomal protein S30 n=1 Tax=Paramacrobiotus metropolitanus TaxID=2943436 RepID=UPI002445D3FB|nr:FAU ubiquitin-like and ribosomal protein S30 [Paramacrobiotus metropolitanus]XP_055346402.1 FAU ubiquitin-like and ribosomal protein S30 [Paramacrobiotus metropolitanus]
MALPLMIVADSSFIVNAHSEMLVGDLMGLVLEQLDIEREDAEDFYLRSGVCNLESEKTLADCGFEPYSQVYLQGRLRGGKVHGSLARAGKVRGQTPKVEKQEKKKKKTGRAKRRLQYNRRFVNVVATFGRRRGPNSNAEAGNKSTP